MPTSTGSRCTPPPPAVAVFGGTLGSVALVLRTRRAIQLLVISLAGIVTQMSQAILWSDMVRAMGPSSVVVPLAITTIGVALVWLAVAARARSWIA